MIIINLYVIHLTWKNILSRNTILSASEIYFKIWEINQKCIKPILWNLRKRRRLFFSTELSNMIKSTANLLSWSDVSIQNINVFVIGLTICYERTWHLPLCHSRQYFHEGAFRHEFTSDTGIHPIKSMSLSSHSPPIPINCDKVSCRTNYGYCRDEMF